MIYKLIILVASIFMIYEFTKSRSTAVASIEPNIIQQMQMRNLEKNKTYTPCNNSVIGVTGERVCLDNWTPYGDDNRSLPLPDMAWLKLNGA